MRLKRVLWNAAAAAVAVGGMLFTAPGAYAGTTTLGTSGETSLIQVLANIYNGGTVTGSIGDASFDWSLAKLTRVQDTNGVGNLDLHLGTGGADGTKNDRSWVDGVGNFTVEAKIAGNSQEFGYYDGAYTSVLTGASVGDTATAGPVVGSVFQWVLKSGGNTWYSHNLLPGSSIAPQDMDHMVTWQVEYKSGPKLGGKVWIVAWEDLPSGISDFDYQDLVVEISVVPLPAAAWSGLAVLAGLGAFGYLRRRQRMSLAA